MSNAVINPVTSSANSPFSYVVRVDGIAIITLDVAGEPLNTLKAEFAPALHSLLDTLAAQHGLRGLVITSGKPDCFVAGADLTMLDSCADAAVAVELAQSAQQLFRRLETLKVPVVAAIDGVCLGGGLELALACHYRVCSDNPKTRLGLPEVQLGLLPGGGGTQRLPRLIGASKALPLLLTGRQLQSREALKLGLVDDAVAPPILLQAAIRLIGRGIPKERRRRRRSPLEWLLEATHPGRQLLFARVRRQLLAKTGGHYPAPARIVDAVERGLGVSNRDGFAFEAQTFGELVMTPESQALRQLFFAGNKLKKSPLVDAKALPVSKVAVLGGGLMGAGIAWVTANQAQLPVRIKEINEQGAARALAYIWQRLQARIKKNRLSNGEADRLRSRISSSCNYQGFTGTELVIEAVFEQLDVKRQMVAEASAQWPQAIFASNTSSLPIAQIAAGAAQPERIIGLHYFSPVDKMPLVEVIPHAGTAPEVVATVVELARRQGKTPIVVGDSAGFYVNRILVPYLIEAGRLLAEGESIERVDRLLSGFGFPVGPFALIDEVGLDVASHITPVLVAAFGERFAAPELFTQQLASGRKGRKTGAGFYLYPAKGSKRPDGRLYKRLGLQPKGQLADETIINRPLLLMLNEAVRCLDEGVVACARDADLGAVFGIGFPPFIGGPLRELERRGLATVVAELDALAAQYGERFTPCDGLRQRAETGSLFYPTAAKVAAKQAEQQEQAE